MTNFFDLASPREAAFQFASDGETPLNAEEIAFARDLLNKDKDHNLVCLGFLFLSRGDKNKARSFFDQIQDHARQAEDASLLGELVEA